MENTKTADEELQKSLLQFYQSEFERTKAVMFANGKLTEEMIKEGASRHFRTKY